MIVVAKRRVENDCMIVNLFCRNTENERRQARHTGKRMQIADVQAADAQRNLEAEAERREAYRL